MAQAHPISRPGRWEGYAVTEASNEVRASRSMWVIRLEVELLVPRVRVPCPQRGPKLERLSGLDPDARVTRRLGKLVGRLCEVVAIRQVARFFGLDWKTGKNLDRTRLGRALGPLGLNGIEVIVEPSCKRVQWVGRGRRVVNGSVGC